MSIIAIFFGVMAFIKHGEGKVKATIGILLGSLCLIPTSSDLFSPEKALHFKPSYKEVSFLGNSNIVGFQYCKSYNDCFISYTYDVSTQNFSKHESDKLDDYSFSRDGSRALFTEGSEYEQNIIIMNADGSERKQLTHSSDKDTVIIRNNFGDKFMKVKTNLFPSFSPDGKRVIFVRYTNRFKERSGFSGLQNCDIYEVDVETGNERKLTNYNFFGVDNPKYLSDGKRFIFSAIRLNYGNYEAKYKNNKIFIMDKDNTELKPAMTHSSFSRSPSISFDNKIVYIANPEEGPSYRSEVFMKVGDKIICLTKMKSDVDSPEISSDGNWIVFKEFRINSQDQYRETHFWIMKSDGTELKELNPPRV